jgi:hypothetical protein
MFTSLDQLRAAIVEADGDSDQVIAIFRDMIREDLLATGDVGERLGISLSAANMRSYRGNLPAHSGRVATIRVWLRPDVEDFISQNPRAVRHTVTQEVA